MFNRRRFLSSLSGVPVIGSFFGGAAAASAAISRDYFAELGVKPIINAAGTYTTFTASLMRPEVMDAIQYASKKFYRLNEVHDAVGQKLASLLECQGAMVTSGAASALTLGTAACVAGKNQEFIQRLPDTTGMKNEVIVQKAHRVGYDHAVRNVGIKLIEVETRDELEKAINDRTAMLMWFNFHEPDGQVKAPEFISIGKKHNIPTFSDAAADTPPVENLKKFTKMGFDLVAFSGGKGIRGPQSAGLLLGRKDLIEAARMNASPNGDTIGRGMKVNKEEMLGMLVAVETFLKEDPAAVNREYERRAKKIADSVARVKGMKSEIYVPEIANHVPHLRLTWDESATGLAYADVKKRLRDGTPSIEVVPTDNNELSIGVWMLQPGEAEIVAGRLQEIMAPSK